MRFNSCRMETYDSIKKAAEAVSEQVLLARRTLHANPELSFEERETSRYVADCLREAGIEFRPIAGTGVLARIEGRGDLRRCVVLRADMDALPIEEKTGLEYASRNKGVMHACGHDVHTACLLGAMLVLKRMSERIEGTVFGLFQPGEELCPGGASLVLAVEEQLKMLLENKFEDIIISAKSSSVEETARANAILANRWPFPLHIGITEAGCGNSGIVKGAVGIGLMLAQGIGDTIRVSLTSPGAEEVETGYNILQALGLRSRGWQLVSCPTCGRRRIEVAALVEKLRAIIPPTANKGMTIAVMGCEVNGPKEASGADFGVAGSPNGFIVFKKGAFLCRGEMEDFEKIIREQIVIY